MVVECIVHFHSPNTWIQSTVCPHIFLIHMRLNINCEAPQIKYIEAEI